MSGVSGNKGATDLAVADVIIHEILHAYMHDWAEKHNLGPNPELTRIMNLYFDPSNNDYNGAQHATMAQMNNYMGTSLLQYSQLLPPTTLPPVDQNYCESLAWKGLQKTDAYKEKAASNPVWADNVDAIITVETFPDAAGATMGSSTGPRTLPTAKGRQACP